MRRILPMVALLAVLAGCGGGGGDGSGGTPNGGSFDIRSDLDGATKVYHFVNGTGAGPDGTGTPGDADVTVTYDRASDSVTATFLRGLPIELTGTVSSETVFLPTKAVTDQKSNGFQDDPVSGVTVKTPGTFSSNGDALTIDVVMHLRFGDGSSTPLDITLHGTGDLVGAPPPPTEGSAPTIANVQLSETPGGDGDVTIHTGTESTLYLSYDWSDPDGDIAGGHLSYKTLSREIDTAAPPNSATNTSGDNLVSFKVPGTDGPGVSTVEFFAVDKAGHQSNRVQLHYTTTVSAGSVNIAGRYRIRFVSQFGQSITESYDLTQAAGTNGIGWQLVECEDPGNPINCFHMDGAGGRLDDSLDGRVFHFAMNDGGCSTFDGTFTFSGNQLHIQGTKDAAAESFCTPDVSFPSGTFTGDRQ